MSLQSIPGHVVFSATAGFAGALASVSAKFVMGDIPDFLMLLLPNGIPAYYMFSIFRGIFVLLTLVLNGLMWFFYVRALRISGNSLQALAINTACNFVSSAVFGYLIFHDDITVSCLFGASLMLLGIIMMNTGQSGTEDVPSEISEITKKTD